MNLAHTLRLFRCATLIPLILMAATANAGATSGWGCYVPNVVAPETVNVRAGPSAQSAVVVALPALDEPGAEFAIVALRADGLRGEAVEPSLFDVHQAEGTVCEPAALPRGARWCPVAVYDEDGAAQGWLKRRFVDHSECP